MPATSSSAIASWAARAAARISRRSATSTSRAGSTSTLSNFDYVSVPDEFAPRWDVRWRLGARVVAAYYDTTATGTALTQQASNNFVGTGPKGGLEARWTTPLPAFAFFARVDASVLVGQLTQKYYETVNNDPYNPLSGNIKYNTTASVPTFSGSAGLNYTPPALTYLHFAIGYQWEHGGASAKTTAPTST